MVLQLASSLSAYLILKDLGLFGLPDDLRFLYSIFEPHHLRRMLKQFFILVNRMGAIGTGIFSELTWHKKEHEDILKVTGNRVEHGEPIDKG